MAGEHAGAPADAAVTSVPGAALVIRTADCAPVALLAEAAVGVAHAGWRGLVGGVVERTVEAMREAGAGPITARIGPCVAPSAYEFGAEELAVVADLYGDGVRATARGGAPALDLAAGVAAALECSGVVLDGRGPPPCTATLDDVYFSHRARAEPGRQASFVWLEA
jgi:purine-nucleoside/S-methyl-5'-thioadenosine phosphorylase / adenosine deaminase